MEQFRHFLLLFYKLMVHLLYYYNSLSKSNKIHSDSFWRFSQLLYRNKIHCRDTQRQKNYKGKLGNITNTWLLFLCLQLKTCWTFCNIFLTKLLISYTIQLEFVVTTLRIAMHCILQYLSKKYCFSLSKHKIKWFYAFINVFI